jgi:tRNA(adenine34) deaminase
MMIQDEIYMQIALDEARTAFEKGEVPVGAVLVKDQQVIARGYNLRESVLDPTAHAEMIVIKEASRLLTRWRLTDATLYVTLEPCPMCAGAVIQARISRLVFGCFDPKAGACGSLLNIPEDKRFNHRIQLKPGCLEKECSELLKIFFSGLREEKKRNSLIQRA